MTIGKHVNHTITLWYGSEAARRFFAVTGADPKLFWKIRNDIFYIPRAKRQPLKSRDQLLLLD